MNKGKYKCITGSNQEIEGMGPKENVEEGYFTNN
jgi:hypothetical protein